MPGRAADYFLVVSSDPSPGGEPVRDAAAVGNRLSRNGVQPMTARRLPNNADDDRPGSIVQRFPRWDHDDFPLPGVLCKVSAGRGAPRRRQAGRAPIAR